MRAQELDFHLPPELIAQSPPAGGRGASRLLHYVRAERSVSHRRFAELPALLRAGDLMVFNNARVLPARFTLIKPTGGKIEGLFLDEISPGRWRVLLKAAGAAAIGAAVRFAGFDDWLVRILEKNDGGEHVIEIDPPAPCAGVLDRVGRMPLPPYIKRGRDADQRDVDDRDDYQTVYAAVPGAVAAPTAGLHFTPELLRDIDQRGVERAAVTLHVGIGTFRPISAETLNDHVMHTERYAISPAAAESINRAVREGRRIVAVGTTAARVIESQSAGRPIEAGTGETSIFIYPPYQWRRVGALLTNFHLPRSTLIALVAALVGLDEQQRLYELAIAERYRFFSYGDAMFVE